MDNQHADGNKVESKKTSQSLKQSVRRISEFQRTQLKANILYFSGEGNYSFFLPALSFM
jgi:hypothetical protein